jgi:sugar phosphate isomerase/epimerase
MTPTRRHFLHSVLAVGSACAAGTARAIEPIARNGKAHMRLSMAAYSFRQELDLKRKPRPTMTLDDFIDLCAAQDLDAAELTAYYFPETSPEYLAHLKGRCTRLGLDVSGTAVGNNFCVTDADKQREQRAMVKSWTENTARLGGKTMRIFAGNVEKGDTEEKARERCIEAIGEVCDHAAKFGVILALENHGGLTDTIDHTLALVKAVRHDWFGVNLDTGNFRSRDPYADLAQLAPYAVTVQVKTEIQRPGMPKEEAELARLIDILRAANYRGYVALEYEAAEDARTAVPRHLEKLAKLLRPA